MSPVGWARRGFVALGAGALAFGVVLGPAVGRALAATTNDAQGSSVDVETGIKWVVDHGARVVNLSLGGNAVVTTVLGNSALRDGVEYAWAHGAVPVLASGNDYLFGSNYGQLHAIVVA